MNPQQSTLHHYFQFTSNATTTPKKSINKNESKPNLNTPDITNLSITSQHAITTPPPPSASLKFTAKSTNLMDSKTIEKNQLHSSSNYKSDSTFASSSASISSSSRNTFTSKDPKSLLSLIPSIVSSSFSSASHPNSTPTIFTGLDHASIANAPKKYNVSQTSLPSNDMQIDEADYDSYKVPIKRTRSSLSNKRRNYIGSDSNDSSAESDSELISPKKKHGIQLETEMKLGPETKNENGSLTVPIPLGLISPIKQPFFNNGKKKTSSSFKNMIASKSDAFEISALTTATSLSSDSSICAIKLVSESSLPTTSFPIWLSHPKDQQGHPSNHPNYDPSSLFIPKKVYDQMTDFEKQYWDVKANYFDCVVFFQKGKFYELYEIDAELAQREFDLKMSGGTGGRNAMKMAGVPESSLEEWVAKFVGRGYKVVQVDQREKTKDGLLRRDIAMVHSSGTVNLHPWAAYTCVYVAPFLLLIETGVATLHWCHCPLSSQLETLLTRAKPNELVLDSLSLTPSMKRWFTAILPATTFTVFPFQWTMEETKKNCFKNSSTLTKNENYMDTESVLMKIFGEFYENEALWKCIAGCFMFLDKMKLSVLFRLEDMKPYSKIELNGISHLQLDSNTLTHLQLLDVDHPHSLLSILNHCLNPMGQRLLRQWICFPLTSIPQLLDRQSALNELRMHPDLTALKEQLRMLPDLARLLGRIQLRLAKPKDFLSFIQGFISFSEYLPSLNFHSNILVSLIHHYPDIQFILSTIQQSFIFNSTQHILPQSGVHDLYDQLNEDIQQIENELHEYMLKLKLSMKLNNLTYVHMGKDNYQLEVPSSMKVPKDWMRVSATKKVIRYHTPTIQTLLKTMELKQTLRTNILRTIINDVFDIFSKHIHTFQSACECIAQLDVYQSFVSAAEIHNFHCLPTFQDDKKSWVEFDDLSHPCYSNFIANSLNLKQHPTIVLTGPNMGGKSTLLRMVGVSVVLAQLGMWVPAKTMILSPFAAIYTRMGAKDFLMQHMSTFFVELNETATILNTINNKSLVLMDELGRGTGTYDGNAIAFGVLLHVLLKGARVLFATHYPLDDQLPVYRMYMEYLPNPMTFLYKAVPGTCPSSLGTEVARLAGLPESIVVQAQRLSHQFQSVQKKKLQQSIDASSSSSFHPLGKVSNTLPLISFAYFFNQPQTLLDSQVAILKASCDAVTKI